MPKLSGIAPAERPACCDLCAKLRRGSNGSARLAPADKTRTLTLLEAAAPKCNAKLARELRFAIETARS